MLKEVILADNPLDPTSYKRYSVDNVFDFIMQKYPEWPETARIFHKSVSLDCDVTPKSEAEVDAFASMEGPFYVIVFPGYGYELFVMAFVMITMASVAFTMASKPNVPVPAERDVRSNSPNNSLSDRTNEARVKGRIPDIFGTVRSTPDLITVPYKEFINHQEVEHCFMCIGRGAYEVSDIKEDATKCSDIPGTSVAVYPPFSSPNSGTPQLKIGADINTPLLKVYRSGSIDGKVLRPPNDQTLVGDHNIDCISPNRISTSDLTVDFTSKFQSGDSLTITNGLVFVTAYSESRELYVYNDGSFRFLIDGTTVPGQYFAGEHIELASAIFYNEFNGEAIEFNLSGSYVIESVAYEQDSYTDGDGFIIGYNNFCRVRLVNPFAVNSAWNFPNFANGSLNYVPTIYFDYASSNYNIAGTYTILSVSPSTIILDNPSAINNAWNLIGNATDISPTLSSTGFKWVGPFTLDRTDTQQVFSNFVAANGLYTDNGTEQSRVDVAIEIELTPINAAGVAIGAPETFQTTIEGSASYKGTRAATLKVTPTFTGRCKVRARRVSETTSESFVGQVVDEVKWRDLYAIAPVTQAHFGNVTTVQTMTYCTDSALLVKERKLNMLVTRKLPLRVSGSTFTSTVFPTNNAAEIISSICLDRFIGNCKPYEIDFDSIYNAVSEINTYFGTAKASEFNYTFDKDNLSFEETISSIASAVFCTAYRRGSKIGLSFEKQTPDSVLLFNHRNKVPSTETRTVTFGNDKDNDGVEYTYVDPEDDAVVTLYIPEDQSTVNPVKVESIGVRSKLQAWFHAWRIYNKLIYQNIAIEFEATQEAGILVLGDRILVVDNTRPDTQDGEIEAQNGLVVSLSQPVDLSKYPSYSMFIQHVDGSVEAIPITAGVDAFSVVLSRPPRLGLALIPELYARTTYVIVGNTETAQRPFLLTEKTAHDNYTTTLKGTNYSDAFYTNDFDYINGKIDLEGNALTPPAWLDITDTANWFPYTYYGTTWDATEGKWIAALGHGSHEIELRTYPSGSHPSGWLVSEFKEWVRTGVSNWFRPLKIRVTYTSSTDVYTRISTWSQDIGGFTPSGDIALPSGTNQVQVVDLDWTKDLFIAPGQTTTPEADRLIAAVSFWNADNSQFYVTKIEVSLDEYIG